MRNPTLEAMPGPPIGWVLESDGKIVSHLGNIALLYRYGARTVHQQFISPGTFNRV